MPNEHIPTVVMSDERIPAVVKFHFDHYMKLLDLYETRQTSAFNFAILVYGAAGTAAGFFAKNEVVHSVVTGAAEPTAVLVKGAVVLIYSVGVPLVLLPLFYLYIDVSIFCAALSAGSFLFHKNYEGLDLQASDPGLLAFEWLHDIGEDITPHFKRRAVLFAWAPTFGFILSIFELSTIYNQHNCWLYFTVSLGIIVSFCCLVMTCIEIGRNNKVRDRSVDLKRPSSINRSKA